MAGKMRRITGKERKRKRRRERKKVIITFVFTAIKKKAFQFVVSCRDKPQELATKELLIIQVHIAIVLQRQPEL